MFGCASDPVRPKPEICVYRAVTKTFHCYDSKTKEHDKKRGMEANKFTCMSPEDFNTALHFLHGVYKEEKK